MSTNPTFPHNNGSDRQNLQPSYFTPPRFWNFNSPDFYIFYVALGVVISILMVILLLIWLASNKPAPNATQTAPAQQTQQQAPQQPPSVPATAQQQAATPSAAATQAPAASVAATPASQASAAQGPDVAARFASAEQQPSYDLRAEAYDLLRKSDDIPSAERLKATAAYQRYAGLSAQAQRQLDKALYGIEHEHYSQAIRQLKNLIAGGSLLGEPYLKAQQALPRAYLKKIDYFLIKGAIGTARKAYNEAKAAGVPAADLQSLDLKLKNLEKVSK